MRSTNTTYLINPFLPWPLLVSNDTISFVLHYLQCYRIQFLTGMFVSYKILTVPDMWYIYPKYCSETTSYMWYIESLVW